MPGATVAVLEVPQAHLDMEMDILTAIGKHPNLVRFYGSCAHDSRTFLVVEYALRSLREHLLTMEEAGEGLSAVVGLECALQVARGMAQLSTLQIIHRDLAARNVLVFAFNNDNHHDVLVKVADFGLSRQGPNADGQALYYGRGKSVPVRWSPPEVLQRHKFSEKSDVWSFGTVVWEIFTLGTIPYYRLARDEAVIDAIVKGDKLERPANAQCPGGLYEQIMLPCWDAAAARRPTFQSLERTIRETQEALVVAARLAAAHQPQCVVCLARPSSIVVVPCGHQCLCEAPECATAAASCPLCRGPIERLQRIFSS